MIVPSGSVPAGSEKIDGFLPHRAVRFKEARGLGHVVLARNRTMAERLPISTR